jgi:hypothetical protein
MVSGQVFKGGEGVAAEGPREVGGCSEIPNVSSDGTIVILPKAVAGEIQGRVAMWGRISENDFDWVFPKGCHTSGMSDRSLSRDRNDSGCLPFGVIDQILGVGV